MQKKFMDMLRDDMRLRGYSLRTERTYLEWIKRYIYFIDRRHPAEAGAEDVRRFLTHLAVNRHVAINTQKVALNAVVYLYQKFLQMNLGELGFTLAARQRYLLLGHNDLSTTQIYTHVLGSHYAGTASPLDRLGAC